MNTLKLTPTEDGRIKVRVVSQSERDLSAVVSFEDLQQLIRETQVGQEAELPLEPDEVDLSQPVEGEPQPGVDAPPEAPAEPDAVAPPEAPASEPVIDQEPSAEPSDNEAEVDDGPTSRQGPGM